LARQSVTDIQATSGDVANAQAVATLAAAAGKTTYITGLSITGSGATAGLAVVVTVTGLATPFSFIYCAAVGALVANTPLNIVFPTPIPASAVNTAIVVTCPALGTGGAHNIVTAYGYQK
jgi:hypothetical protein